MNNIHLLWADKKCFLCHVFLATCFSRNLSSGLSSIPLKQLFPKGTMLSKTSLGRDYSCKCVEVWVQVLHRYLHCLFASHRGANKLFNSLSTNHLRNLFFSSCQEWFALYLGRSPNQEGVLTVFVVLRALGNSSFSFAVNHKFALLRSILLLSYETGYRGRCGVLGCYSHIISIMLCQWQKLW